MISFLRDVDGNMHRNSHSTNRYTFWFGQGCNNFSAILLIHFLEISHYCLPEKTLAVSKRARWVPAPKTTGTRAIRASKTRHRQDPRRSRPPSSTGSRPAGSSTGAGVSTNSATLGYGISASFSSSSNAALNVCRKSLASGPMDSEIWANKEVGYAYSCL
jgi:hypothetical protein